MVFEFFIELNVLNGWQPGARNYSTGSFLNPHWIDTQNVVFPNLINIFSQNFQTRGNRRTLFWTIQVHTYHTVHGTSKKGIQNFSTIKVKKYLNRFSNYHTGALASDIASVTEFCCPTVERLCLTLKKNKVL